MCSEWLPSLTIDGREGVGRCRSLRKTSGFMCTVCLVHAVQKEELASDGLLLSAGLLES